MTTDTSAVIHYQTGAGIVRCGAKMAPYAGQPGWDMSTTTVDIHKVTCKACLHPLFNKKVTTK